MAPPKRRKLEKINPINDAPPTTAKFYCCRCGMSYGRLKGYFPVSHSPMYRGSGYLPWCNDCVEDLYEGYRVKLGSDREALRRICMKFDIYWNDSIYQMVERTAGVNSRVRNYIGKTNIIRFIDKTFDDTIKEEKWNNTTPPALSQEQSTQPEQEEAEKEEESIPEDLVDFWGAGYDLEFYMELDRRYNDWTGGNPVNDPGERSLYRQICLLETIIRRDSANGRPIEKNVAALNTLMGSMNLKPAQRKGDQADAELESMPLGVGIRKWEEFRPLPETPNPMRDVSGMIKNITTWYLGHACKMVGLKNSYCKAYEDAIEKYRVKNPEYEGEDDDFILNDIFQRSQDANTDRGDG